MDHEAKEIRENTPEVYWKQCLEWAVEKDYDFRQCCDIVNVKTEGLSLAQIAQVPLQNSVKSASVFSRLTLPASCISRFLGTTPYLMEEMQIWAENSESWLRSCDVTRASVLLIADGFDGDGPAWGVLKGAEALQTTVVTSTTEPWEVIGDYGVTACALTEPLLKEWMHRGESIGSCQAFFCLSSELNDYQRKQWQEKLGVPIYRQLGLPGVQPSVIAWECAEQQGYHFPIDSFWPEVICPRTQQVSSRDESGELLVTALRRRSTTAIRLRTGWYGYLLEETCRCGSQWTRFILAENCV